MIAKFFVSSVLVALALSSSAQVGSGAQDFAKSVLDTHNALRAKHGAPDLVWDQQLADFASKHALLCTFKHSKGPHGENWAMGYQTPQDAINGWYSEVALYDFKKPGYSSETGHFTQVVWVATTKVGCAWVECPLEDDQTSSYMVCEYSPSGNMTNEGYFEKNVLPPQKHMTPNHSVKLDVDK